MANLSYFPYILSFPFLSKVLIEFTDVYRQRKNIHPCSKRHENATKLRPNFNQKYNFREDTLTTMVLALKTRNKWSILVSVFWFFLSCLTTIPVLLIKSEYTAVYLNNCSRKMRTFSHHFFNGHRYTNFMANKGRIPKKKKLTEFSVTLRTPPTHPP